MAEKRISVPMQEQIQALKAQGLSIRKISMALGVSRQTVRRFSRRSDVVPVAEGSSDGVDSANWDHGIDWGSVSELSRRGVTVKQLHAENAPSVRYHRFWRTLRAKAPGMKEISLRIEHVAGERTEIDYADGIGVVDASSGKLRKTYLFCGVLSFSSYVYGEFVFDQKLSSFIESQDRMWAYYGGVTPYAVVDNLKSGVHKAHRYDPDVNPTYCAYANHMGFAVLPTRPRKPRDKATIEATIGVIQKGFYQEVRERNFYSLFELNEAFREYLNRLNRSVMKDYGVSRVERFQSESSLLKAIPQERFELSEQRFCRVHPDCHIQVEKNFYSVPHVHVGGRVRVRMTSKLIEVFSEDHESIAVHARSYLTGKYMTDLAHYPETKRSTQQFELKHVESKAREIGPKTEALVKSLLEGDYPLRYLRRIQGILRLATSKRVSAQALEYASEQALKFGKLRLAYIKACAEHFQATGGRLVLMTPKRELASLYLHGKGETP